MGWGKVQSIMSFIFSSLNCRYRGAHRCDRKKEISDETINGEICVKKSYKTNCLKNACSLIFKTHGHSKLKTNNHKQNSKAMLVACRNKAACCQPMGLFLSHSRQVDFYYRVL